MNDKREPPHSNPSLCELNIIVYFENISQNILDNLSSIDRPYLLVFLYFLLFVFIPFPFLFYYFYLYKYKGTFNNQSRIFSFIFTWYQNHGRFGLEFFHVLSSDNPHLVVAPHSSLPTINVGPFRTPCHCQNSQLELFLEDHFPTQVRNPTTRSVVT